MGSPPKDAHASGLPDNRELETALATNGSQKLQSLYKSCSTLSLKQHCPIITVGFWSLMESLAALHAGEGKAFYSYFSNNRLQSKFGFSCKNERKNITSSLKRLTECLTQKFYS